MAEPLTMTIKIDDERIERLFKIAKRHAKIIKKYKWKNAIKCKRK